MEEALYYLETIKISALNFDCDTDSSREGPAATEQSVSTRPAISLSTDDDNSEQTANFTLWQTS